jgi:hypothetical protein
MIDVYNKEEFEKFYNQCKYEGKTDEEISREIYISPVTFSLLRNIHKIESKLIRKNTVGVTEDDFRKGALIGLDRRIILRRVRDGMHIKNAINTPRKVIKRRKKNV